MLVMEDQELDNNQDLTLGIERRHTMMVGVDLVDWRCVAPANGLVSKPIKGVFAHCAEDTGFVKIKKKEDCNKDWNKGQHNRDDQLRQLAALFFNNGHHGRPSQMWGPGAFRW